MSDRTINRGPLAALSTALVLAACSDAAPQHDRVTAEFGVDVKGMLAGGGVLVLPAGVYYAVANAIVELGDDNVSVAGIVRVVKEDKTTEVDRFDFYEEHELTEDIPEDVAGPYSGILELDLGDRSFVEKTIVLEGEVEKANAVVELFRSFTKPPKIDSAKATPIIAEPGEPIGIAVRARGSLGRNLAYVNIHNAEGTEAATPSADDPDLWVAVSTKTSTHGEAFVAEVVDEDGNSSHAMMMIRTASTASCKLAPAADGTVTLTELRHTRVPAEDASPNYLSGQCDRDAAFARAEELSTPQVLADQLCGNVSCTAGNCPNNGECKAIPVWIGDAHSVVCEEYDAVDCDPDQDGVQPGWICHFYAELGVCDCDCCDTAT